MSKKMVLSIAMLIPNLLLASNNKESKILLVETVSESEVSIVENILTSNLIVKKIISNDANNITIHMQESQDKIDELITQLQAGLGHSVKIEQLASSKIKKGSQDNGEWGK